MLTVLGGSILKQPNGSRYGKFKIKFANDNIAGTTLCVNSLEDILLVLKTYKKIVSGGIGNRNKNVAPPNESGMMFTQVEENGRYVDKTNLHCYSCGIKGGFYKEFTQPWHVGMNTTINYNKNLVPPQPGNAWVKPMTAAPMGT